MENFKKQLQFFKFLAQDSTELFVLARAVLDHFPSPSYSNGVLESFRCARFNSPGMFPAAAVPQLLRVFRFAQATKFPTDENLTGAIKI